MKRKVTDAMDAGLPMTVADPIEAERGLILGYAPVAARDAVAALFALDARLGAIVAAAREPLIGQMRLTWWHDALVRLDAAAAPAEPVLQALAADVLNRGVSGADLATIVDGWQVLLAAETLDDAARADYAEARGATLFGAAGRVLDAASGDPVGEAGRGWALADLSRRVRDAGERQGAAVDAMRALDRACGVRWSARGRILGATALAARMDLDDRPAGSPRRVARLAWHRVSGR